MSTSEERLQSKVREFLLLLKNDKSLHKLYSFSELEPSSADKETLLKLISEPFIIKVNDNDGHLYYVDENGDTVMCPDLKKGLSFCRNWLSELLPPVPFDIEQGGNLRKANEAEKMYCCLLVAGILGEPFISRFEDVVRSYNFKDMRASDTGSLNFQELLDGWQKLQNMTIRIIVSGAHFRISDEKKSEVGFTIGSLNREETIGVVSLRKRVKDISRAYMEGPLSKSEVSKLNKIERLTIIQEKDDKILSEINKSSDYSQLYKICCMNSDYLLAKEKLIIEEKSLLYTKRNSLELFDNDSKGLNKFASRCKRKGFNEAVMNRKEIELYKWRECGNERYVLPSKL